MSAASACCSFAAPWCDRRDHAVELAVHDAGGAIAPALASGNHVVWTARVDARDRGACAGRVRVEDDLPPGAFNLSTGPGAIVGDEIARNPGTHGVGFIGSTETGRRVAEAAAGKAAVLELGGNGPVVVLDDADWISPRTRSSPRASLRGPELHGGRAAARAPRR